MVRASKGVKRVVTHHIEAVKQNLEISPRLEAWLTSHGGEFVLDAAEAQRMGKLIGDHLSRIPRVRSRSFSASSAGSCERAQVFGYLGVPGWISADSLQAMIFIDGKIKHLSMQFMLLEAGAITDIEVPIDKPNMRLKGSIDGVDEDRNIGVEIKSTRSFSYFLNNGPSMAHKLQVTSYRIGRPDLERWAFLYWDTATREHKEFIFEPGKEHLSMVRSSIERLNEAIDHRQLPGVLNECAKGKGQTFNQCGYSHICLGCDFDTAEAYGSVTQVAITKAPNVPPRRRLAQHRRNVR